MNKEERKQAINEILESIQEWSENYNCEHEDSGSNYGDLISEGFYPDQCDRLLKGLKEKSEYLDQDTQDQIEKIDLEWCTDHFCDLVENFEMESGSIFFPSYTDRIILDSFSVGEIEEQIEFSEVFDQVKAKHGIEVTKKEVIEVLEEERYCFNHNKDQSDHFYLYINTDSVWYAMILISEIEELINDFFEEQETRLSEALESFNSFYLPELDQDDSILVREEYNNYLDRLNKENTLHDITVFNAENPF